MDRETELALCVRAKEGDAAARVALVNASQPLVRGMVRGLRIPQRHWADAEREGVVAILVAINRFDPTRGVRFETFASWRVRDTINDYRHRVVNLGTVHTGKRVRRARNARRLLCKLTAKQGELSTEEEAAAIGVAVEDVLQVKMERQPGVGLHGADVGVIGIDPVVRFAADELCRTLDEAVGGLRPRERLVVARRYMEEATLEDVGKSLGVTGERARQIEVVALRKLRAALCVPKNEELFQAAYAGLAGPPFPAGSEGQPVVPWIDDQ